MQLRRHAGDAASLDRKSTRLNSSHQIISYAVFCLKKKNSERGRSLLVENACVSFRQEVICRGSRSYVTRTSAAMGWIPTSISSTAPLFFFNDTAPPEIYPLSLHSALPI